MDRISRNMTSKVSGPFICLFLILVPPLQIRVMGGLDLCIYQCCQSNKQPIGCSFFLLSAAKVVL